MIWTQLIKPLFKFFYFSFKILFIVLKIHCWAILKESVVFQIEINFLLSADKFSTSRFFLSTISNFSYFGISNKFWQKRKRVIFLECKFILIAILGNQVFCRLKEIGHYGLKNLYLVTALIPSLLILKDFIDFFPFLN